MKKEDAINLAQKALKDIGHWESFKIEKAFHYKRDSLYDYNHWVVSFNFTKDDWYQGEVTPVIIVNDEEDIVTFISWKKSSFLLQYDKEKDKYFHPTLSR